MSRWFFSLVKETSDLNMWGVSIGISVDGKRVAVGGDELWGSMDPMVEKKIVRDVKEDRWCCSQMLWTVAAVLVIIVCPRDLFWLG